MESLISACSVPPLPLWERSDRIARCDPGEGLRSIDRPEPLTPTLSHKGEGTHRHRGNTNPKSSSSYRRGPFVVEGYSSGTCIFGLETLRFDGFDADDVFLFFIELDDIRIVLFIVLFSDYRFIAFDFGAIKKCIAADYGESV